jgi:sugar lactone lactonase YvrE
MRLWLGVGVALVAAVVATGALGVSGSDTITTIAGSGVQGFSGDGGPAVGAQLYAPEGVAVDGARNVYIADAGNNNRVRKVSPGGTITTIAGGGSAPGPGWGDGGPATSAQLRGPNWVAVDGQGNVYISDFFNSRVRKVNPGGTITAFAGTGTQGFSGDGGPATSARLLGPQGVAVDKQGNVYIVDGNGDRVRKVNTGGTITTFAGTGIRGFSGDGGPATSARLNNPEGVAVDGAGNVYIADLQNGRVRKVSPGGTITTLAGGGSAFGDGGPATSARVRSPYGVAVDGQGNVYIADRIDHRVRTVSPGGTISTFAGTGAGGFSGDGGPATSAQVFAPWGMAVDGQGNVYIGDDQNRRVRKVSKASVVAALKVTLGGAPTQRLLAQKAITVTARSNKPCSLAATGSVTILGTRYVFGLTPASAKLAAAGSRTLTIRLPAAALKRFRLLWKAGLKARATITVRATDKAGRTSTSKRIVAVRR